MCRPRRMPATVECSIKLAICLLRAHVRVLPVCGACPSPLRFPPAARLASQDGSTPLITASFNGHGEVVDRLIAARATVDAADKVVPVHSAQLPPPFSSTHYRRAM